MANEERRKPSPEGQGLPRKKTRGVEDDEDSDDQGSASSGTRSPGASRSTQRTDSQRVRHSTGGQSARRSKSPKHELSSAVLSLCCGASSGKEKGNSPTAPVQRRTPSPKSSLVGGSSKSLERTPKKSSLRQKTPPPQAPMSPEETATPMKSSLKRRTPPREPGADTEASKEGARKSSSKVVFADIKEGVMPYDDYLFKTFRYRKEVRERLPAELLEEERRRRLSGEPDYLQLAATGALGPPQDMPGPSTSGFAAPSADPPQIPPSSVGPDSGNPKEGPKDSDSEDSA